MTVWRVDVPQIAKRTDSEDKRKEEMIFGIGVSVYWGIPNACFVPGNMQ